MPFRIVLYFTLLFSQSLLAQTGEAKKAFKARIAEMHKVLQSNPDEGYLKLKSLLKEAREKNFTESELVLLSNTCWYFLMKNEFDNVIKASVSLEEKATAYKSINYQAVAHIYLCQIYIENDLRNRALDEYNKALKILDEGDAENESIIGSKANAHTYIANLYYNNNEIDEAINKMALARKQILLQKDKNKRFSGLFRNYSNTGTVFERKSLDSAQYYIERSLAVCPVPKGTKDFIVFLNYSVLGDISLKHKNFKKALEYYTLAENTAPEGADLKNRQSLYEAMVKTHLALGDSIAMNHYRNKLNEVKLEIADAKYKSLHSVVKQSGQQTNHSIVYGIGGAVIVMLCALLVFLYFRKSKVSIPAETVNSTAAETEDRETVNKKLVELCGENHADFIPEFNCAFPYFKEKLVAINEGILDSEVEFCAYLKLNLTTKDIARIKNLEPKTIQNRKYRIRKKLNIPNDTDIYFYFNLF
ncbi:tetratricopeptide repeat protein [Flavobacterium akiainvivens]|nr:LuxR C-terminal-related transcriptional regulator [Flavobacterium akiainvivens]